VIQSNKDSKILSSRRGFQVEFDRDQVPRANPFTEKNSHNLFILVLLLEFAEP
jgi:hypothetical protein